MKLSVVKDEQAEGKEWINKHVQAHSVIKRQQTLDKEEVKSTYHLAQELWLGLCHLPSL